MPIIQGYIDQTDATHYWEPFVGGANIIDKITCKKKFGTDINHFLIEIYNNLDRVLQLPDEITREEYNKVRNSYHNKNGKYPDWYIGAIGFLASYNGKFFGGYAGKTKTKGGMRNYYDEARRNLFAQIPNLEGIRWKSSDYYTLRRDIKDYIIYCDIPYKSTTGYQKEFNHESFWEWAKEMSKNNIVLVSEQQAPDEWSTIWQQEVKRTLDNNSRSLAVEKIFELQ